MRKYTPTQNHIVFDHLYLIGSITQQEALILYGVGRLASRINELKNCGIRIYSKTIEVIKRSGVKANVSRYWLNHA